MPDRYGNTTVDDWMQLGTQIIGTMRSIKAGKLADEELIAKKRSNKASEYFGDMVSEKPIDRESPEFDAPAFGYANLAKTQLEIEQYKRDHQKEILAQAKSQTHIDKARQIVSEVEQLENKANAALAVGDRKTFYDLVFRGATNHINDGVIYEPVETEKGKWKLKHKDSKTDTETLQDMPSDDQIFGQFKFFREKGKDENAAAIQKQRLQQLALADLNLSDPIIYEDAKGHPVSLYIKPDVEKGGFQQKLWWDPVNNREIPADQAKEMKLQKIGTWKDVQAKKFGAAKLETEIAKKEAYVALSEYRKKGGKGGGAPTWGQYFGIRKEAYRNADKYLDSKRDHTGKIFDRILDRYLTDAEELLERDKFAEDETTRLAGVMPGSALYDEEVEEEGPGAEKEERPRPKPKPGPRGEQSASQGWLNEPLTEEEKAKAKGRGNIRIKAITEQLRHEAQYGNRFKTRKEGYGIGGAQEHMFGPALTDEEDEAKKRSGLGGGY